MENQQNNSKETPAFGIALFIGAILFIILLNQLPFPEDYGLLSLAGIFLASCFVGGIIFAAAAGLINAIYKVIIEIAVVLLLLFNVSYVAFCWASFEGILMEMDIGPDNKFIGILILALILFIIDLLSVIVLLPFARIADSDILDI